MYPWRNRIRAYARQLEREGIVVTASWLRERKNPKTKFGTLTRAFLRRHAVADAADVCRADALVLFTVRADTPTPRGGRHTEFGIALAAGKRLIVCGPRENIFHFYPGVRQFDSFQAVKAYLIRLKKSGRRK